MHKILAVDFDGTVVTHQYPEIGTPVPKAIETLKRLNENGVKIILWTMRSEKFLDDAVKYLEENGVELWGINSNPEQKSWTNSPKAYAQIYVDDAALGCPLLESPIAERPFVDWFEIEKLLIAKGFLCK